MLIKSHNKNYKIRVTKCYLVEVVDKDGNIQEFNNNYGQTEFADDYYFGDKEGAIILGENLVKLVERSAVDKTGDE